jgi:hypothetical protein
MCLISPSGVFKVVLNLAYRWVGLRCRSGIDPADLARLFLKGTLCSSTLMDF